MRRAMLSLAVLVSMLAATASAQEARTERTPSHCIAFVENTPGVELIRVASTDTPLRAGFGEALAPQTVRISYLDHAMFLIETPGGLTVVTDYNAYIAKLPKAERPGVSDVKYYVDDMGRSAVAVLVNVGGTQSTHLLIYDKQNKRTRLTKFSMGN